MSGEFGTLASRCSRARVRLVTPRSRRRITSLYGIEVTGGLRLRASHDYVAIVDARSPDQPRVVFDWVPPEHTGNPGDRCSRRWPGIRRRRWEWAVRVSTCRARKRRPARALGLVRLGHRRGGRRRDRLRHDGDSGWPRSIWPIRQPKAPRLAHGARVRQPADVAGGHSFVGWLGATGTPPGGRRGRGRHGSRDPRPGRTFGRFPMLAHLESRTATCSWPTRARAS